MNKIALPKKIEFKDGKEANEKLAVIEPCYPGYGVTLGNALRRVLLSSLSGAAVVGVKIKGASHEFMTLPHVKEDVLEIILNLKQLRMKVHSDEAVVLELDARGEKEVKASGIKPNSAVEIVNPDLTLAHITDMAGNLNMELYVAKGSGYEMVESREGEKHEIGYIEIDSIFTPIRAVGINIENVRVGKMTNWERLILNIKTDGTINPEDAFKQSVDILIKQFSFLIGKKEEEGETETTEEGEIKENAEEEIPETPKEKAEEEPAKKRRGRPKKE